MSKVIVISGAGTGFGALTARALADAGNIVCAGIRETAGRNAGWVGEAQEYAKKHSVDLRTVELDVSALMPEGASVTQVSDEIARIVALPDGTRPFRSHVDPANDGSEEVCVVADRVRSEFLNRIGLEDLQHPAAQGKNSR